jgi:hypothetical protein
MGRRRALRERKARRERPASMPTVLITAHDEGPTSPTGAVWATENTIRWSVIADTEVEPRRLARDGIPFALEVDRAEVDVQFSVATR